ncbi:MAG: PqqD family protein [Bacillota bacterium]|nr:PqqD family protein [Bacillota bacterium]
MKKNKKVKKSKKESKNFLDFIPIKVEKIETNLKEDGFVDLIIPRDGFLDKIVRKIAKTPDKKVISLDLLGSSVWKAIDSYRNVGDIAMVIKEEFGEDADPLYDRLLPFINLLSNNEFITLKRVDGKC